MASHPLQGRGRVAATPPAAPAPVDRTRPLFPYSQVATYSGHGDPNDAASFTGSAGSPLDAAGLQWLGSDFYKTRK